MVHGYDGDESHWTYKEQVHTKWANRANSGATAKFLSKNRRKPVIMKQDYCCDSEVCIEKESICDPLEEASTAINIDAK